MGYYTAVLDKFLTEEEKAASDAACMFSDDDDDDDSDTEDEIDEDIVETISDKGLVDDARAEAGLTAGMHVWHYVEEALKTTFPGWPEQTMEFDAFRRSAMTVIEMNSMWSQSPGHRKVPLKLGPAPIEDWLAKHRPASKYLQVFLSQPTPLSFIGTKKMTQYYVPVLKVMAKGVKYVSEQKRAKYLVRLAPVLKRGKVVFDTGELYQKKLKTSVPGSFGASTNPAKKERCIWVMVSTGGEGYDFYSHFGKLGRFHHSSFTGGSAVTAAGEWFVEKGKCTLLNACSGHYQPEPWRFQRAYQELSRHGVIGGETEIQVWRKDKRGASAEHRAPAVTFMNRFDDNLATYQMFPTR